MTHGQAIEMAAKFREIGGFTSAKAYHPQMDWQDKGVLDAATDWKVELWSVNAKAGNRNLHVVSDYSDNDKGIALIAKIAKKTATKNDQDSFARMAAERLVNAE